MYTTAATLASLRAPTSATRYSIIRDLGGALFYWLLNDTKTADNVNVIAGSGGATGNWIRVREDDRGANLTNADATIQVSGKRWRVLPAATLSANHSLTLGTTYAVAGDTITITRLDTTANTYAIINGGTGAGTIATMPVSARSFLVAQFDGTDWSQKISALML